MATANRIARYTFVRTVLRGWGVAALAVAIFAAVFTIGTILSGHAVFLAGLIAPLVVIGLSMLVLAALAVLVHFGSRIARHATQQ